MPQEVRDPKSGLTLWSVERLKEKFDSSVHDQLLGMLAKPTTRALVVFECQDMWSSHFGQRTAMMVGEGCTYTDPSEVIGKFIGDVPSRMRHPTAVVYPDKQPVENP